MCAPHVQDSSDQPRVVPGQARRHTQDFRTKGETVKFRVERDVLADAVAWAARTLPSRPSLPVLAGLVLTAGDDALTLSSFDYEVSARVEVICDVEHPGTTLVSGRLLSDIAKSLPAQPVTVSVE